MNQDLADGIATLESRASIARVLAGLVATTAGLVAIGVVLIIQGELASDAFYLDEFHLVDLIAILHVLTLLASFISVGMWIYCAHRNLHVADLPALEYTPGWVIGWYAIPFANLFKPFLAMKELWYASHGAIADYSQSAPGLLWVWWLSWIFSNLSSFGESYGLLDAVGMAMTAVSAITLIPIINKITAAQPSMSIATTFD